MKELIVSTAHDTGNLIVKELPGDVICEMDPIPDAEKYARLFAMAEKMYEILNSPSVRDALIVRRDSVRHNGSLQTAGAESLAAMRQIYSDILTAQQEIREINEYVSTIQFQNNDRS